MFDKILIANRGAIASRVIRTARRLGFDTVAVFSDADAGAPHVLQADEAVAIGASPAASSYLNIAALVEAARRSGAEAVHPGYGFLSERPEFVAACEAAGLVFIGPPAAAMRAMGDKAQAKQCMRAAGVACVPGYMADDPCDGELLAAAGDVGLPLLVKAVAGGGGRGIRVVRDMSDLPEALTGARQEALKAFGDGRLMLERLIEHGRHIEIQVFADAHGQVIHLGERDCTTQRRRQKVIEEAPSPIVTAAMREAMGRDAVAAARAVDYRGAGTVEFIVDARLQHHFLEMNTRIQVEHGVTEFITGQDLVEWQLRVACGETLPLRQDEVRFEGHAIQARLYAEDPCAGWQPQTGRVLHWHPEAAMAAGNGVRIDSGIAQGSDLTPQYDGMVAKIMAHGRDRRDAIRRLRRALVDAPLIGPRHNGRLLHDLLANRDFAAAEMTTTRLDEWTAQRHPLLQRARPAELHWQMAAALLAPQAALRPIGVSSFELTLACDGETRTLRAPPEDIRIVAQRGNERVFASDGVQHRLIAVCEGRAVHLADAGAVFVFIEPAPGPRDQALVDPSVALSPMAGVVARVAVQPGDAVAIGQPLVCIEAMKMELWLHARMAGTVRAVAVKAGQSVASGQRLVELQAPGNDAAGTDLPEKESSP